MKKSLRQCFAFLLLSVSCSIFAHDFEADYNGATINYTITSHDDLTVCVTFKGNDFGYYTDRYTGSLEIPETVTYDDVTYTVDSIGWAAFYGCTSLKSVVLPDAVTSIGDYAFYNCTGVTAVDIPDTVTTIGNNAFCNCQRVKSVVIGQSVTSIGAAAFRDCRALNALTLGNSVVTIGDYAFYSCPLKEVVIPDSVVTLGSYAFGSCTSLASVTLGYSMKSIGANAFSMCNKLATVTMGPSVSAIGEYAFTQCRKMTTLLCRMKTPSEVALKNYVFNNVDKSKCALYVPYGSKALYADAAQWKDFTSVHEIGDVNADGCFAIEDVTAMIEMVMSDKTAVYADIDGDGSINIGDITVLINIMLGE